jgi:hypothetical protein
MTVVKPSRVEIITNPDNRHFVRAYLHDNSTLRSPTFATIEEARAFASETMCDGLYLPA